MRWRWLRSNYATKKATKQWRIRGRGEARQGTWHGLLEGLSTTFVVCGGINNGAAEIVAGISVASRKRHNVHGT